MFCLFTADTPCSTQHVRAPPGPPGCQWHKCFIVTAASVRVCLLGNCTWFRGHWKIIYDINPSPLNKRTCCRRMNAPTHNPSVTSHFPSHAPLRQSNRSHECVLCLWLTLEFCLCLSVTYLTPSWELEKHGHYCEYFEVSNSLIDLDSVVSSSIKYL